MKVDFLKIVQWNGLKFLGHVTIIHVHLPMKQSSKWMHEYGENSKIIVRDGSQFLENCALEFVEIA